MKLWLLIVVVLIGQELVSTSTVLEIAYQEHYSFVLIGVLFFALTVVEVTALFHLGHFLQRRFAHAKFVRKTQSVANRANAFMGTHGTRFALIVLTIAYAASGIAFVASWLPVSFWEVCICSLIGNALWFLLVCCIVFGIATTTSSLPMAIVLVCVVSLVIFGIIRLVRGGMSNLG